LNTIDPYLYKDDIKNENPIPNGIVINIIPRENTNVAIKIFERSLNETVKYIGSNAPLQGENSVNIPPIKDIKYKKIIL